MLVQSHIVYVGNVVTDISYIPFIIALNHATVLLKCIRSCNLNCGMHFYVQNFHINSTTY